MEKIKQFLESEKGKDILIVLIVILVGLASFGLGRLSKDTNNGIKIEQLGGGSVTNQGKGLLNDQLGSNVISAQNSPNTSEKVFFASSRGSKYYGVSCSAGKNIKVENRIYFNSASEAEGKGYTLASSCQ